MRSYARNPTGEYPRLAVMSNLRAKAFQHSKTGITSRVWTEIDGIELWFESDDIELKPSAEALGTLWLIPALLTNRSLEIDQPVCATWYQNVHKIIEFLGRFWGTKPIEIIANPVTVDDVSEVEAVSRDAASSAMDVFPGKGNGLFFTCGTDSFYTLLTNSPPEFLVFLETFDVPSDEVRSKIARERLEKVASSVGSKPITIRTNTKKHPTFNAHRLGDTHSSFLAAAGHLLSPHMVSITISPSWHKEHHEVTGSNWRLDPLWSSASFQVIHGDSSALRFERVRAIADNPLVQDNLHVCFENYNCSRCEKCVRTMVELELAGQLKDCKTFDTNVSLIERVDNLQRIKDPRFFEEALNKTLEPRLEEAITRLFRRNAIHQSKIEDQLKQRRYVDDQFPKIQEGLNNALHHYSLLQEEHTRLSADYDAIVGNLPIKKGITFMRKVAKKLRNSRANKGTSHE